MPDQAPQHRPSKKKVKQHARDIDARKKWHHLYGARWRAYRKIFLQEHPLCECDQCQGKAVAASIVDHIRAHRGDYQLFWDPTNHQAMSKPCHDRKTRQEVLERQK